jgi:hypothetical protein
LGQVPGPVPELEPEPQQLVAVPELVLEPELAPEQELVLEPEPQRLVPGLEQEPALAQGPELAPGLAQQVPVDQQDSQLKWLPSIPPPKEQPKSACF